MSIKSYVLRSVFCGFIIAALAQSGQGGTGQSIPDIHTGQVPFSTPAVPSSHLSVQPVPEPNAFMLGLSGLGAMLAFRRMFFR